MPHAGQATDVAGADADRQGSQTTQRDTDK